VLNGHLGALELTVGSSCVASTVARNDGYVWGISRSLGEAVLLEALVESGCDAVGLPRN
jgi:hypothetical protein